MPLRQTARLSWALLLTFAITACAGTAQSSNPASALPQAAALRPHIRYLMTFVNYTRASVHVAEIPNSSRCMNHGPSSTTIRPHQSWDTRVNTRGSGSCLTARSIFYMRFTGLVGGPFNMQFEKKVHANWVARYSNGRTNARITFCWYGDPIGGNAVIVEGNRCIV